MSNSPFQLAIRPAFRIVAAEILGVKKVLRKYLEKFIEKFSAVFCVQGVPFLTTAALLFGNAALLGSLANATEHPRQPSLFSRLRDVLAPPSPK